MEEKTKKVSMKRWKEVELSFSSWAIGISRKLEIPISSVIEIVDAEIDLRGYTWVKEISKTK